MKRIIDGRSYNTDTATKVARWPDSDAMGRVIEATLYQTRGGAFFVVEAWETSVDGGGDPIVKTTWEVMTRDEVARLVQTGELEIIDAAALEPPPEATAKAEASATLYLRLTASLKARVDAAAKAANLSVNAYGLRCLERCLASHKAA